MSNRRKIFRACARDSQSVAMSETREIYIIEGQFLSCLSKFYPVGVLEVYIHFQEIVREKGIQRRTYEGVDLTPKVMKYNTP